MFLSTLSKSRKNLSYFTEIFSKEIIFLVLLVYCYLSGKSLCSLILSKPRKNEAVLCENVTSFSDAMDEVLYHW